MFSFCSRSREKNKWQRDNQRFGKIKTVISPGLQKSIHAVAVFEAVKGALVLAVGCGLLRLLHKDAHMIAIEFITHIHLNPAQKYPKIFIDLADNITDSKLWFFAGFALLYSAFRFIEGYGLWKEKTWAEWLAIISGTMYLPVEIYEIWVKISSVRILALAANFAVVGVVAYALIHKKQSFGPPTWPRTCGQFKKK